MEGVRDVLSQARELRGLDWIYFEGGEPFLYYPILVSGVREASRLGFRVGVLSNCYWATTVEDALEWLRPFAGLMQDLSISSDLYHSSEKLTQEASNAASAAKKLGIPVGVISITQPDERTKSRMGQLPPGKSTVMFRGRAAIKLASSVPGTSWNQFTQCPHEKLHDPGRVHLDPFGGVHICQGIRIGNVSRIRLRELCRRYDPRAHPIVSPLLEGGPSELTRRYDLPHKQAYADACHLCYETRKMLRSRFPEILGPDQMYGIM